MAFIPSRNKEAPKKVENNLEFVKEEIEFLIAKLSDTDFKGREVEILYSILVKLQEKYKRF
jgi:polyhydroxyalkanoate synthesis regulator phasin|tara:strand:- start:14 stop:196 length:183 start_codon:yes stop_codon:yes gene_type:complete